MNPERMAIGAILSAAILNAVVGAGFYHAYHLETGISPLAGVYIRIACNLLLVPLPWLFGRSRPQFRAVWDSALWLWGAFGVLSAGSYYLALLRLGSGMTMFLNTGSGLFVASLAPLIAGQAVQRAHFLAVVGCFMGMALIALPPVLADLGTGLGAPVTSFALGDVALGVASGLFAALAYLIVARTRSRYSTDALLVHWTLANFIVMGTVMAYVPTAWPTSGEGWCVLLLAGLSAAGSQYMTAFAYQRGRASLMACLSFLGPVLCVIVDGWFFHIELSALAWCGVGVVTLCGMVLPFMRFSAAAEDKARVPAKASSASAAV